MLHTSTCKEESRVDQQQQSRWRPTGKQILWAGGVAALAFLIIVVCGYLFGWKWTGLPKRTAWDWLDLLIVPIVLAVGGYLFTRTENQRTLQSSQEQREVDWAIAKDQVETDRTLADERRQDDTLQAYLDGMSQLLTENERPLHRAQPGDSLSTVARARTLTVLGRLDGGRKRSVLQFLYESGLISSAHPVLDLSGANLSEANLQKANLSEWADLYQANLIAANLRGANLERAELEGTILEGAILRGANLYQARRWTEGQPAAAMTLEGATMPDGQVLRGGKMPNRPPTFEESLAKSLEGTTIPDGQTLRGDKTPNGPTFEDWLKDREGRREDEKKDE
jgi:hypothetical protein